MLFLYVVQFGCHGNVTFEGTICIIFMCVLSIVRSDMDYLGFVQIVNSNFLKVF